MSFEIQERVVRITKNTILDEVGMFELLRMFGPDGGENRLYEMYVDTDDENWVNGAVETARRLHKRISRPLQLIEPEVIGPLSLEYCKLRDQLALPENLANGHIRTTSHSFEVYCQRVRNRNLV